MAKDFQRLEIIGEGTHAKVKIDGMEIKALALTLEMQGGCLPVAKITIPACGDVRVTLDSEIRRSKN